MAAPFNVPLPAPGQKPWNLNPAVEEVRSRIGAVNDLTTTGRLSEANLNAAIVSVATTSPEVMATYVTFKNFDGSPVVGKNVVITLTADGTDIHDITVEEL